MKKVFFILIIFHLITLRLNAQNSAPTNLEVTGKIFDKIAIMVSEKLTSDFNLYNTAFPEELLYLQYELEGKINKINQNFQNSATASLVIIIDEGGVRYPTSFRDGFFGDISVERKVFYTGKIIDKSREIFEEFSVSQIDTIKYSEIEKVENSFYTFLNSSKPGIPFFSHILEPVILIGTAVASVILFFTVRSN
ncbi:MAG: hypothetical protein IAE91_05040 [Ignavibacteriaceae bacterium]|nr:hypothetical protein [Ignavibacteriaceae bacterium]